MATPRLAALRRWTVEQFYTHVFTQPKETYSSATQLGITFTSGYIAGVFCALISQPADNLVSQVRPVAAPLPRGAAGRVRVGDG